HSLTYPRLRQPLERSPRCPRSRVAEPAGSTMSLRPRPASASFTFAKARWSLVEEGTHAFDEVIGRAACAKARRFGFELRRQALRERLLNETLTIAHRCHGPGNDRGHEGSSRAIELGLGDHAVDQPETQRVVGPEAFAEQQDFHRLPQADQPRERVRQATVRRQSKLSV